ncbi:hypothetical protein BJ878DRAFT_482988 [Calycina marina]|uniref:GYF domain-containing protein n=1 Tax=Calycina marina TaxID=1763456 RepID=A0A9P8CBX3_9HELO|nr:hypothetical protein BJ878DRAFT_482988 [Calycina marina]
MTSRFSAARPSKAGEKFARIHHNNEDQAGPSKKPKFDVRNPSALAPDAPEEDAVLEADVIGGSASTKRGAVNLDGYDSDSDNEGFDARADERAKRKKGDVDIKNAFDYSTTANKAKDEDGDEDEDDDMFGGEEDGKEKAAGLTKKRKEVDFQGEDEIEKYSVLNSKSGGHVSGNFALDPKGKLSSHAMDDQESSDDEYEAALAAIEEGVDDEVGAGGKKRNAPKVDAFNMIAEQEEGRFDDAGNFVRKAQDPDSVHDQWLEGVSKKDMKKAADAHEKREEERRQKRIEDDAILLPDILRTLILQLERGETVLEALARLGKGQSKTKKVPKWKLKKQKSGAESMDIDAETEDPEQAKIREKVEAITGAADQLLTRGQTDIYEQEREILTRQYKRETGEDWVEPKVEDEEYGAIKSWEYRWIDGREETGIQGPFDSPTMIAWQDAGYFGEGIEFRRVGGTDGTWSRVVEFV